MLSLPLSTYVVMLEAISDSLADRADLCSYICHANELLRSIDDSLQRRGLSTDNDRHRCIRPIIEILLKEEIIQ